ncbi:hypothetical protein OXX80_007215 [Metschnikowia pulcherrima]
MDVVEEPYKQYEIREGIVFLLELSEAIYTPIKQLDGQSQIGEILNCINDLLSEMVMTFPNNGVGIYLYNCENTGSKYAKNSGLNKIFSLNDLNSSNMKSLINMLQDDFDESRPLKSRFPPAKTVQDNLHTVLKTVLREFQRKPQYNRKKLFWFTNNDKPYINDKLKDSLRTMVSDFEDNYIHVSPLFLDTFTDESQERAKPFDASLYHNIFLNTNYLRSANTGDDDDFTVSSKKADVSWSNTTVSSQIRDSIFRLKEVKRVQFSCNLILSDGPGIGGKLGCSVKGYTLYNHEQIRQFKKVSTESGEIKIAHNDTKQVKSGSSEETKVGDSEEKIVVYKGFPVKDASVMPNGVPNEKVLLLNPEVSDYIKSYAFDHVPSAYDDQKTDDTGDNVVEDGDANAQIEFSNAPYLKLLCFRNVKKFQPYFNMKPPIFVAADLNDGLGGSNGGGYANSFTTFKTLFQSCVRLKKYAILFGCPKKNSKPDLYALYPTNLTKICASKTPDGFLLFNLPWLSEIRSLPDHVLTDEHLISKHESIEPQQLVDLYGALVDKFEPWASYEPSKLSNPTLHYFYKTIKHEALQLDIETEDPSLKANDWSVRRLLEVREKIEADPEVQEILRVLTKISREVESKGASKRAAEQNNVSAKKPRAAPISEAAVITMWQNNTWDNVRVDQLREFMGRYDAIKKATKKADMIANITEYLESRKRE